MPLSGSGTLTYLVNLVEGIEPVQGVTRGVPTAFGNRLSAFVALGAQRLGWKAQNKVFTREAAYLVEFGYRVTADPATVAAAEDAIAAALDELIAKLIADQTLGATAEAVVLDLTLASSPDYQLMAGQEFRRYPVLVWATQRNYP